MINISILLCSIFLLNLSCVKAISSLTHIMRKRSLSAECGYQLESSPSSNDNSTLPLEYPWLGMLIYQNSTNNKEKFACNAVLINDRYVLTAAQCVTSRVLVYMGDTRKIRLGSGHLDCVKDKEGKHCSKGSVDFRVEQVIIPDNYQDTRNREDDIALLRLDRIVEFTDYIRPVCLPESTQYIEARQELHVTSWGREYRGLSRTKAQVMVKTWAGEDCYAQYNKLGVSLTDKQMCAQVEAGYNACDIISGAPLLAEKNGQFIMEAILSFGTHCTATEWPDVYTAIPEYMDWIDSKVEL